jgi:hypothetical protein
MTVNELKCLLNELPEEFGDLPVVANDGQITNIAIGLYFERFGGEYYNPEQWDIFEWDCYVNENPDNYAVIII